MLLMQVLPRKPRIFILNDVGREQAVEFKSGIVLFYLIAINAFTFVLFGRDKWLAQNHRWRIRERNLLLVSLLGGAVGGLISMHVLRHKTRRILFRWGLPLMVFVQGFALFHFFW